MRARPGETALWRLVLGALLQGAVFVVPVMAVAVLVGESSGVAVAGVVLSVSATAGRVVSAVATRRGWVSGFATPGWLAAVTGVAGVVAVATTPWWVATGVLVLASAAGGLVAAATMHAAGARIPASSAAGMLGQAGGMALIGLVGGGDPGRTAVMCAAVCLAGGAIPYVIGRGHGEGGDDATIPVQPARAAVGASRVWVFPFVLALVSYGPLGVFATLVVTELGASWAGPQFLAYAAGSIVVALVPWLTARSNAGAALLAACGCALWVTGLHTGWYVLGGRFVMGVLMFAAQGSVLTRVSREHGKAGLASALAGLTVGAQAGLLWAGFVAEASIGAMASASSVASVAVAAGARWSDGRVVRR